MAENAATDFGRSASLPGWRGAVVAGFVGALIGLGQVPFSLYWLALPGIVAAYVLFLATQRPLRVFWLGWAVGVGYAAVSLNWIVEPFLVDLARHGWMAPFALFFMASGFGLFWGGAFALAHWSTNDTTTRAFSLVLTWTGAEVLRSYALTGFPWALVSYIWVDTPILQFSSILGPHGLTMVTLALCCALVLIWRSRVRLFGVLILVVLSVGLWAGANWIAAKPVPGQDAKTRPIMRLVQPNAPQDQKWDPEMMPVFYARQIDLTSEPADPSPDLVIWPEVAVPFLLNDPSAPFWEISGAANDVPVILGAQRLEGNKAYNSIAVLGEGGEISGRYDKHHLVPFGEYLPFAEFFDQLGLRAMTAQFGLGYSPGSGPAVMDLGDLGLALPMVCYETIFPHELRRTPRRPDWMMLLTNDAWFGEHTGPYQHLAQARARSVELGLPMVRVANTGISAMIDARGHILASIPLGVAGRIDVTLPATLAPTLYATFGDFPVMLVIMLGFAAVFARNYGLTKP